MTIDTTLWSKCSISGDTKMRVREIQSGYVLKAFLYVRRVECCVTVLPKCNVFVDMKLRAGNMPRVAEHSTVRSRYSPCNL